MNVREALEKVAPHSLVEDGGTLAPIIERALREAYREGFGQAEDGFLKPDSEYGVTAGVDSMMEEK